VRLVLDSSVLLAAIARPGVCAQLLDEVTAAHILICSQHILDEVSRKLRDKFGAPAALVREVTRELETQAEMVQPTELPPNTCRDPSDVPVLGTAVAGNADMLITVDKDLLALGEFHGIPIVKPGEFWKRARH
jgi:putative PIN family toxin of toxin-antitoxin system